MHKGGYYISVTELMQGNVIYNMTKEGNPLKYLLDQI